MVVSVELIRLSCFAPGFQECDQGKKGNVAVAASYRDPPARANNRQRHGHHYQEQPVGGRGIPNYACEAFQGKTVVGGRGLRLVDLRGMLRTAIS